MGRKTLLLGETNSGKTRYTFNFICSILQSRKFAPADISVLDFAPFRVQLPNSGIGGTIRETLQETDHLSASQVKMMESVRWIERATCDHKRQKSPKILTPRYSAKSPQDVLNACCNNFIVTQRQLLYYFRHPTKVLIINDVGIYLHLGGLRLLTKVFALPQTALLNAYFGRNLLDDKGSYISRREEIVLLLLSNTVDTYLCDNYLQTT
jgi:hypothetical protein